MIITSQLDDQQLAALDLLSADCKNADGNLIAIYRHLLDKARPIPCNVLYYEPQSDQKKLIGFLRAFFFYETVAEIAVMVAPAYRRQGIASQMLNAIQPTIDEQATETLVFSTPHGLNDPWLSTLKLTYQNSEYQMHYQQQGPITNKMKGLNIRMATEADIPTLCAIDNACFPKQQPDMQLRFHALLTDANYALYIINQDGVPVGKAHLCWQSDGARLSDIAVLPRAQSHGFGSALIAYCVNHALAKNKPNIVLDVETNNQNALRIYSRLGFVMTNAHDYWRIPLNLT